MPTRECNTRSCHKSEEQKSYWQLCRQAATRHKSLLFTFILKPIAGNNNDNDNDGVNDDDDDDDSNVDNAFLTGDESSDEDVWNELDVQTIALQWKKEAEFLR